MMSPQRSWKASGQPDLAAENVFGCARGRDRDGCLGLACFLVDQFKQRHEHPSFGP